MKRKKHINCAHCGNHASWYKKGKNHRVLVCNSCGIIASNPIPLLMAAGRVAAGLAVSKGIEKITSKPQAVEHQAPQVIKHDNLDKANAGTGAWYVEKALRGDF